METEVIYQNLTKSGKFDLTINCRNEVEYLLSVENRKWLYPKMESMLFSVEHLIRADPTMVEQINKILNKTVDDLMKLVKISQERFK